MHAFIFIPFFCRSNNLLDFGALVDAVCGVAKENWPIWQQLIQL